MKTYGLTGGVGMGKSTAAGFFFKLGVRLVDTDEIARQIVQPGQPALREIQTAFGDAVVSAGGELKREELARIVFAEEVARKKLEAILHPRIREIWQALLADWRKEGCPLAMVVIPLLFETQAEANFDRIICVASSPATQAARLGRRGWSPAQVRQRIAAQWPVEQKIARADFMIWTEGTLAVHESQARDVFKKLSRTRTD